MSKWENYFNYALFYLGIQSRSDVVRKAYNFNCPLIPIQMQPPVKTAHPWFTVDSSSVILETVKPCEPPIGQTDTNIKKVVVRLFESSWCRTRAKLVIYFKISMF